MENGMKMLPTKKFTRKFTGKKPKKGRLGKSQVLGKFKKQNKTNGINVQPEPVFKPAVEKARRKKRESTRKIRGGKKIRTVAATERTIGKTRPIDRTPLKYPSLPTAYASGIKPPRSL